MPKRTHVLATIATVAIVGCGGSSSSSEPPTVSNEDLIRELDEFNAAVSAFDRIAVDCLDRSGRDDRCATREANEAVAQSKGVTEEADRLARRVTQGCRAPLRAMVEVAPLVADSIEAQASTLDTPDTFAMEAERQGARMDDLMSAISDYRTCG